VYKDYYPVLGGVENHLRNLARAQAALGHEVSVLVTGPGARTTETVEDGVRVVRVPRFAVVASTPLSFELVRRLARERPDVTHLQFPYPPGEMAQDWFGRSRATVLTYHGDVVRQRGLLALYRPLLLRLLARVQLILASSPPLVQTSPYLQRFAGKTVVVPHGIPTARFDATPPATTLARLRSRFGGPGDARPLILSVGRLVYYKGFDVAIAAMRELDARLVIVGKGPNEAALKGLVRELGLESRVWFVSGVDDEELAEFYHAADVYVSAASHRSEAYGLAIVEGMACGKPVITTELGTGTSFVNLHESTGLVVPPSDPAALAAAIRRLLSSPAERERFGAAARRRVAAEFTLEVMTRRMLAAYERALGLG